MSEAKHTPGPWAVEDPMGADMGFWIVQAGLQTYQWSCIAAVHHDDEDTRLPDAQFIGEDEQKANARLIAAAPEMLAALHGIFTDWDGEPEDMLEVRAAIAKAEGKRK